MELMTIYYPTVISMILSIGLLAIYRYLDQKKFQLSRVKRFTDNVMGHLEKVIGEKEKGVRSQILELEDLVKRSELLGEYLKDQNEMMDRKMTNLESKDGLLRYIDGQLSKIDEVNCGVDSRLKVLRNQDGDLKDLMHLVDRLREKVQGLEGKFPDMEKGLMEASRKRLGVLREQYERDYREVNEELELGRKELVRGFSREVEDLMEGYHYKIDDGARKVEGLKGGIDILEEELKGMKEKMVEDTADRYEKFDRELGKKQEEYMDRCQRMEVRFLEMEEGLKSSIEKNMEGVQGRLEGFNGVLNQIGQNSRGMEEKLLMELEERVGGVKGSMEQKLERLKGNLNEAQLQVEDFLKSSNEGLNVGMREVEEKLDGEKRQLELKMKEVERELVIFGSDLKGRFSREITQLMRLIEEDRQKANKERNNISIYLDHFLESEKEKIHLDINGLGGELKGEYKGLERSMNQLRKEGEEMRKEFEASFELTSERLEGLHEGLKEKLEDSFEGLRGKFEEEGKSAKRVYEGLQEGMEQVQRKMRDRILLEVKGLSKVIEEKKEEVYIFFEESKGVWEDKGKDLEGMLMGVKDYYHGELKRVLRDMRGDYEKVEQEYSLNHTRLLKSTEVQVKGIGKELEELEVHLKNLAEDSILSMNQDIEGHKKEFGRMLGMVNEHIEGKEKEFMKKFEVRGEGLMKKGMELERGVMELKDRVLKQVSVEGNEIRGVLGKIEQRGRGLFEEKILEYQRKSEEFKGYFEGYKERWDRENEKRLGFFRDKLEQLGKEVEGKLGLQVDKKSVALNLKIEALDNELSQKVGLSIEDTEKKLLHLNEEIKKIRDCDLSIEDFNRKYGEGIEKMEGELRRIQEKLGLSIKEEYKKVRHELEVIDERIEAFTKDSRVFKKADRFYDKLRQEIEQASLQVKRIREERDYFGDFENKVRILMKEREELLIEIGDLESRKGELKGYRDDLEGMMRLCKDTDKKLERVKCGVEIVEGMEQKIVDISRGYEGLESQLSGLNKELESGSGGLGRAMGVLVELKGLGEDLEDRMERMRKEVKGYEGRNEHLSNDLGVLEKRLSYVEKVEGKLEGFMDKFNQMDSFVMDIEKRTGQLEVARKRLNEMEMRLEDVQLMAEDKIMKLSTLTREDMNGGSGMDHSKTSAGGKEEELLRVEEGGMGSQDKVMRMYRKGFDIEKISTLLNLSKSEVKLSIDMSEKRKQ